MWISSGGEDTQWYYWFLHMDWIELIYEKIMLKQNSLGSVFSMFLHMPAYLVASAAAKSLQSCPTLCDLINGSPLGSSVPGILQARILEWVAISFNAWKWKVKVKLLSRARLLVTPWTGAYQAPPSMGFSRQEYWSGVPLLSPLGRFSRVQRFVTLWTVACQDSLSMGFSRKEYWSG